LKGLASDAVDRIASLDASHQLAVALKYGALVILAVPLAAS